MVRGVFCVSCVDSLFFFFKQKTAYELRISDWSSDVCSSDLKKLLDVVSHTPIETEGLLKMMAARGWVDAVRHFVPPAETLFSWWSYRSPDWEAADKGRRLDHVWVRPQLQDSLKSDRVAKAMRGPERSVEHTAEPQALMRHT